MEKLERPYHIWWLSNENHLDWGLFLIRVDGDKVLYGSVNEGTQEIVFIEFEDSKPHYDEKGPHPLFKLGRNFAQRKILDDLVEELAKNGFVAEIDNKQRIAAEALADERKTELEYFKDLISDVVKS